VHLFKPGGGGSLQMPAVVWCAPGTDLRRHTTAERATSFCVQKLDPAVDRWVFNLS